MLPTLIQSVSELRNAVRQWRANHLRVGLVPTMGALHAGHLSLVDLALTRCDRIVVSVFVNPTQFAPHEDFDRYPRMLEQDVGTLRARADIVFAPNVSEMYPSGSSTSVSVAGPALGLESEFRPHFFAGVATVVAKLLTAAEPDVAVFGEKDYQQLLVVRQLAQDLLMSVEIVGAPIKREPDGLALSSRNAYLSASERKTAARLNEILRETCKAIRNNAPIADAEVKAARALTEAGFDSVDYVAVRDAKDLSPITALDRPARILAAAKIGKTRLIDNMAV